MPCAAFSFAMLARLGPCAPAAGFAMPAPALAVDHKLPKASPPADAGLAPGLVVKVEPEAREGVVEGARAEGAGTEVK